MPVLPNNAQSTTVPSKSIIEYFVYWGVQLLELFAILRYNNFML